MTRCDWTVAGHEFHDDVSRHILGVKAMTWSERLSKKRRNCRVKLLFLRGAQANCSWQKFLLQNWNNLPIIQRKFHKISSLVYTLSISHGVREMVFCDHQSYLMKCYSVITIHLWYLDKPQLNIQLRHYYTFLKICIRIYSKYVTWIQFVLRCTKAAISITTERKTQSNRSRKYVR